VDLSFDSKGDDPKIYMGGEDISKVIRSPEMDMLSSAISAVKEVREAMTELQRRVGTTEGLVAEGRDMGTVVFPDSIHKFFITASTSIRAERRYHERLARGEKVTREDVEMELIKRDEQDSNRLIAPLQPAEDAIIIDTSNLNIDQVVNKIMKTIGDDHN
ncbi:(d)CMP kinase, partial [Thermodesulfobacteriota bacterium]